MRISSDRGLSKDRLSTLNSEQFALATAAFTCIGRSFHLSTPFISATSLPDAISGTREPADGGHLVGTQPKQALAAASRTRHSTTIRWISSSQLGTSSIRLETCPALTKPSSAV